jgi:hypothetical protein
LYFRVRSSNLLEVGGSVNGNFLQRLVLSPSNYSPSSCDGQKLLVGCAATEDPNEATDSAVDVSSIVVFNGCDAATRLAFTLLLLGPEETVFARRDLEEDRSDVFCRKAVFSVWPYLATTLQGRD